MKTKIWNFQETIEEEDLEEIVSIIEKGGVIIFPTDTVYGIACDCGNENAIKRMFRIKNRKAKKPIGVLTDSVDKIKKIAHVTKKEQELIEKYMPGALTIILKKKENISDILTANLDTIGVRIPNEKITLKILERFSYPLAVTSANLSGEKEGNTLEECKKIFERKIEGIVDGGPTKIQVASTIVKVEKEETTVLRKGTIKIED